MRIEEMRSYILEAYPGQSWRTRCNMMGPQQVVAVYYSIKERKEQEAQRVKQVKKEIKSSKPRQLTIFNFGVRKEDL